MTDHPDPATLRLEGQRLVEAATRDWALSIADPISRIPPGDRSMRENALVDLAQATRTLLTTLAALTEERDRLREGLEELLNLDRVAGVPVDSEACSYWAGQVDEMRSIASSTLTARPTP